MFRRAGERAGERLVPFDADRPALEEARRDPRRFEILYRRYVGQVYNFAVYELRDHHAAEDLTEQVFLQALAGLNGFEERGTDGASTFRVWLFQIARNAASNERRRRRRHPEAPIDLADDISTGVDVAGEVAERDAAARAWRVVDGLPADRRQALRLRYVNELSTAEIAGILGRSEGAVRVLIHRALRAVAAELARGERRDRPS